MIDKIRTVYCRESWSHAWRRRTFGSSWRHPWWSLKSYSICCDRIDWLLEIVWVLCSGTVRCGLVAKVNASWESFGWTRFDLIFFDPFLVGMKSVRDTGSLFFRKNHLHETHSGIACTILVYPTSYTRMTLYLREYTSGQKSQETRADAAFAYYSLNKAKQPRLYRPESWRPFRTAVMFVEHIQPLSSDGKV